MNKNIWSKEYLEDIVKKSDSYSDALRKLNLAVAGGNLSTLKKKIKENGITVEHFTYSKHYRNKERYDASYYFNNVKYISTHALKKKLIEGGYKKNICENPECLCKDGVWNGKPIICQLHHINGDHNDNRLENLMMLCPNCHSQTENYCGNSNKPIKKRLCAKCGKELKSYNSKLCPSCSSKLSKSLKRPPLDKLIQDFKNEKTFTGVAKIYEVSDKAVAKWFKHYKIPSNKKDLLEYINNL